MKVEFEVKETPEPFEPLTGDAGNVAQPAPKATMILRFDGEVAMELTEAKWIVYPPFRRMEEAGEALRDAEIAHRICKKLFGKSNAMKYLATGGGRLDLNVSAVSLTADEAGLVSRMMKRE